MTIHQRNQASSPRRLFWHLWKRMNLLTAGQLAKTTKSMTSRTADVQRSIAMLVSPCTLEPATAKVYSFETMLWFHGFFDCSAHCCSWKRKGAVFATTLRPISLTHESFLFWNGPTLLWRRMCLHTWLRTLCSAMHWLLTSISKNTLSHKPTNTYTEDTQRILSDGTACWWASSLPNGQQITPHPWQLLTGQPVDVSIYMDYHFWQLVIREDGDGKEILGQWCGPAYTQRLLIIGIRFLLSIYLNLSVS